MKNFIRGMGVGMLITTMVLGIAYMLVGKDISDSEVKERAKKLGMVEESQGILRNQNDNGSEPAASEDAEGTVQDVDTLTTDAAQPEDSAEMPQDPAQDAEAAQQVDNAQEASEGAREKVSVTIKRGQDGISISQVLQQSGVVADAADFNKYLSENKLQMYILHGTFELEKNMPYEDIVKQIVRK